MSNGSTLLVIARKFNDIFYALSTLEWNQANRRILAIFASDKFAERFPFQQKFDDVSVFCVSEDHFSHIAVLKAIRKEKKRIQCDMVMLSNIVLVDNQYLIKMSGANRIFLLEDGLMNYYDFRPKSNRIKSWVQKILGINERMLFTNVAKTYLLAPELARFYNGKRCRLNLSSGLSESNMQKALMLQGKKIFVGQCLYRFNYMSLPLYNERINKIVKTYDIDYYLPHAFALEGEQIDCPILDIGNMQVTLELLASYTDFSIYSFCSSVLYTTRIINPKIKSYLIRIPELVDMSDTPVIKKYCNHIIDF